MDASISGPRYLQTRNREITVLQEQTKVCKEQIEIFEEMEALDRRWNDNENDDEKSNLRKELDDRMRVRREKYQDLEEQLQEIHDTI